MKYSIKTFELSLKISTDGYNKLIESTKKRANYSNQKLHKTDSGYLDKTLIENGILVEYIWKHKED